MTIVSLVALINHLDRALGGFKDSRAFAVEGERLASYVHSTAIRRREHGLQRDVAQFPYEPKAL